MIEKDRCLRRRANRWNEEYRVQWSEDALTVDGLRWLIQLGNLKEACTGPFLGHGCETNSTQIFWEYGEKMNAFNGVKMNAMFKRESERKKRNFIRKKRCRAFESLFLSPYIRRYIYLRDGKYRLVRSDYREYVMYRSVYQKYIKIRLRTVHVKKKYNLITWNLRIETSFRYRYRYTKFGWVYCRVIYRFINRIKLLIFFLDDCIIEYKLTSLQH